MHDVQIQLNQVKLFKFRNRPGAGDALKADGGGKEEGRDRDRRVAPAARGAQVPRQGDKGRDTVPWQQAAGFREPRGARCSRAGLVYRPLSSLQCQKEKRGRSRSLRRRRRRPRGATEAGLSTGLSSEPSLRGHPAGSAWDSAAACPRRSPPHRAAAVPRVPFLPGLRRVQMREVKAARGATLSRRERERAARVPLAHVSLLFPFSPLRLPLSLSLSLSLSPEAPAEGRIDGRSFRLSIKRRTGLGRAPPATSCPGRVGTEGCAVLPPSSHPFAPRPFHLPLLGPPTPTGISHTELWAFPWPAPPPSLPVWSLSKGPREYSAFVIASSHLLFL